MRTIKKATALLLSAVFFLSASADAVFAKSVEKVITGFEETGPMSYVYSSKPSEEAIVNELPDTIGVYINYSTEKTEIPVTWESLGEYDDCEDFYYEFDPVWDNDEYVIGTGVESPYASIYTSTGKSRSITPMASSVDANETAAFEYLTEKVELNVAAACGILANLYAESQIDPKNLQDSYESSLGYTDSSYTKAVDNGSYSRKKFGNDSAGYGICQWTYYSRKYDLYDYAQDKDKSIGNMSMQLLFMKRELTSSQISKLKSFDNSAQGAYDAAAYFCSSYERPANTEAQSKKRGNLAKDTYWKRYKGSVTTSSASKKITISGATQPGNMVVGESFTIAGKITGNDGKDLISVAAGAYDSDGDRVIGKTVKPNSEIYNLSNIDDAIKFSKLPIGTYFYKVAARTSSESKLLVKKEFKVKPKQTTLSSLKVVSGKKLKVTWKTNSGVDGYQVRYSTSKDFGSYKNAKAVGDESLSKTLSSLTKGKKYYVKVRGYNKVNGTNYFGPWSSTKLSDSIIE